MDETTTPEAEVTEAPVTDVAAQPDGAQQDEAVDTTTEPISDPSTAEPAQAENSTDDDLSTYWSNKGIDITTPEGQAQAAKSYREAERAMHRKGQEASQLSKQLTEQPVEVESTDPLVQELANEVVTMKRAQNVSNFREAVNLTPEQEKTMAEYLVENPQKTQLVNAGLLSLQEVYNLSGAASPDPEALKRQGGQEALQKLESKQKATAPIGAATTPVTAPAVTRENFDSWYEGLSASERSKPETQEIVSRLLS